MTTPIIEPMFCTRKVCQRKDAVYFNTGNRCWYCPSCAHKINDGSPGLCVRKSRYGSDRFQLSSHLPAYDRYQVIELVESPDLGRKAAVGAGPGLYLLTTNELLPQYVAHFSVGDGRNVMRVGTHYAAEGYVLEDGSPDVRDQRNR